MVTTTVFHLKGFIGIETYLAMTLEGEEVTLHEYLSDLEYDLEHEISPGQQVVITVEILPESTAPVITQE